MNFFSCSAALPSDSDGFSRVERSHLRETADRAGVWFFSPDAANWLAVRAARWLGMPYCDARVSVESAGESIHYQSARNHKKAAAAEFKATYGPTGPVCVAAAGTLDHWLTERYCLFSALRPDRIVYGEIHHSQWLLQPAAVELRHNTMVRGSWNKNAEG